MRPSAAPASADAEPADRPSPSGAAERESRAKPGGGGFAVRSLLPERRKLLRWSLPVGIAALVGIGAGITVAAAIQMPKVDSLVDFTPARITRLFDRDGNAFSSYARERRILLAPEEVPPVLRDAVIAVEDSNFYRHGGLDAIGGVRAVVTNLRVGGKEEGASTLTMQLARQLFLSLDKTWRRKFEETLLAVELEKTYSKEQILTLYLNYMFLGHRQYGMEAGARFFFGKSVGDLSIAEAATLAGILQRPNTFSPYRNPEAVVKRRNKVIRRMLDEGFITREEHDAAVATPLEVVQHRERDQVGAYFSEEVRRYIESTYGEELLLERGLQVETTLDQRIQRTAEEALHEGLIRIDRRRGWRGPHDRLEGDLESIKLPSWDGSGGVPDEWFEGLVLESKRSAALVKVDDRLYTLAPDGMAWTGRGRPDRVLERGDVAWFRIEAPAGDAEAEAEPAEPKLFLEQVPKVQGAAIVLESATGAVRAMVGGWSFAQNQFNRATQARRQTGSAFKLFVYGAALEAGFTPADTLFDGPVYFPGEDNELTYSPRNNYPKYYGIVTLSRALAASMNVTAVKLLDLVGVDRVIDFARRAGIQSDLPPYPSLALGVADLSPIEVAAAYAAIANQGTWVEPYLVERIRTPEGRTLEEHIAKTRTTTSPQVAYVLTTMLEEVIDRGTGRRMRDLDVDLAGKTGTTNDYSDAWFVGFTPRETVLVWVGHDVKRSLGSGMDGASAAGPIWREILVAGLENGWIEKGQRFTPPPGISTASIELATGLRAAPGAAVVVEQAFVPGTEPTREYTPDLDLIMGLPWYQQEPFYVAKEGERMPADFEGLDEVEESERAQEAGAKASGPAG